MNLYILYSVTALGIVLSLFSMLFIFLGKSIAGTGTGRQIIKLFGVEIQTNSVMTLLIVSLFTAGFPLGLEFYLILKGCIDEDSLMFGTISERKCESLKGKYELSQNYEFINTAGIKATAKEATWTANTCIKGEKGSFVLRGSDETTYHLVVIVRNNFEDVGKTTTKYNSDVLIDKNGQLISRTVYYETKEPSSDFDQINIEDRGFNEEEKAFIAKKLGEYDGLHKERHRILRTKTCSPALSENNGGSLLAFVCYDYTRAMTKL